MKRWLILSGVMVLMALGAALLVTPEEAKAVLLEGTFVDDNNSPHQNGIEAVAALEITAGCNPPTNNRYCPNRNMTRAEAATFLARAYGYPDDGVDYFVDDDGHPLEGGINRIAAAEITAGCNPPQNNRFCPDRALTRAEFATFIVRAENLAQTSTDFFSDDDGHVLENAINAIAEAKITVGCNPPSNTAFCPQRVLSRGETATFLTRALSLSHNPQRIPLTDWNPVDCSKDGVTCSVEIETFSGRSHYVEEGLFQQLPYGSGEESDFTAGNTEFTLTLDGNPVSLQELGLSSGSSQARRMWRTTLVFTEGSHVLVGEWRWRGDLIQRTRAFLDVG